MPNKNIFFHTQHGQNEFIRNTIKDFIASGKKQLMLCCRADVSENEARYITRRIEKEVTAKIENVLVRFCSDIPREWFPIIQKVYIQAENHEFNSIEEVIEKIASEGKQAGLISATDAALTLKYAPMYKT